MSSIEIINLVREAIDMKSNYLDENPEDVCNQVNDMYLTKVKELIKDNGYKLSGDVKSDSCSVGTVGKLASAGTWFSIETSGGDLNIDFDVTTNLHSKHIITDIQVFDDESSDRLSVRTHSSIRKDVELDDIVRVAMDKTQTLISMSLLGAS